MKSKILNVNNMLTDTVQSVNHIFIISTAYVSKIVRVVQFKHRSINVRNVKMVTDLKIQANVFKLSTDLIGTRSTWTFSHLLTQPQRKNSNKFSHPES